MYEGYRRPDVPIVSPLGKTTLLGTPEGEEAEDGEGGQMMLRMVKEGQRE